jgi:hypothetical protein
VDGEGIFLFPPDGGKPVTELHRVRIPGLRAAGMSYAGIAAALGVSENTVNAQVNSRCFNLFAGYIVFIDSRLLKLA